jgi:hypothetical protein
MKDFLNRTPIAQEVRVRTDNYDYNKFKNLFTAKETIIVIKRQPTEMGENLCQLTVRKRINIYNA